MESNYSHERLESFRIAGLPPEFYYIPNFITPEEEASILDKVHLSSLLMSLPMKYFLFNKAFYLLTFQR